MLIRRIGIRQHAYEYIMYHNLSIYKTNYNIPIYTKNDTNNSNTNDTNDTNDPNGTNDATLIQWWCFYDTIILTDLHTMYTFMIQTWYNPIPPNTNTPIQWSPWCGNSRQKTMVWIYDPFVFAEDLTKEKVLRAVAEHEKESPDQRWRSRCVDCWPGKAN